MYVVVVVAVAVVPMLHFISAPPLPIEYKTCKEHKGEDADEEEEAKIVRKMKKVRRIALDFGTHSH